MTYEHPDRQILNPSTFTPDPAPQRKATQVKALHSAARGQGPRRPSLRPMSSMLNVR